MGIFKRDKQMPWSTLLQPGKASGLPPKSAAVGSPEKGTLLNPLSADEIASLPRPVGGSGKENRPSGWAAQAEALEPTQKSTPSPPAPAESPVPAPLPPWVASVEERGVDGGMEVFVRFLHVAGELTLDDLELDFGDGQVRLGLRSGVSDGAWDSAAPLVLPVPLGTHGAAATARWRKKARAPELRFPYS